MAATAAADSPSPTKLSVELPRASVVAVTRDGTQAVLWDEQQGEYLIVREGDRVRQFTVTAIDGDHVVLTQDGSQPRHYVLPRTADAGNGPRQAPAPRAPAPRPGPTDAEPGKPAPSPSAPDLIDPYAGSSPAAPAAPATGDEPVDPYGPYGPYAPSASGDKGSPAANPPAIGPIDPYDGAPSPAGRPAVSNRGSARPGADVEPIDPYQPASPAQPAPADAAAGRGDERDGAATAGAQPASKSPAKRVPRTERYAVERAEFDAAVTDFQALSEQIEVGLTDDGIAINNVVSGSIFHRLGLRAGDLVTRVGKRKITTIDDAAAVYAELIDARSFTIQVQRGDVALTIHYDFAA